MSTKRLLNDEWRFAKFSVNATYEDAKQAISIFQKVDLPHDWLIYDTKHLYEDGQGWYCRDLEITEMNSDCIVLRFDGIYMNSTVYVNGGKVCEWKYGYSTFESDITDYLHIGENEIMVQVLFQSPNSRWYSGAGIYRNVWLKTVPNTHFVSDGIYISTNKKDHEWNAIISSELTSATEEKNHAFTIRQAIYDSNGNTIATAEDTVNVTCDTTTLVQNICVQDALVWDIDSPNLYTLVSELYQKDKLIEHEENRFGFRTICFTANHGFFLNGKHLKLYGTCEHHDLGCLGAATNKQAIRRRFQILKQMGVNAIRTSHNMPSVEFMELADEMGFLIDSEAFDMWECPKTTYDYARFFKEWSGKDVASWIRRDRNHPSIILWSIGNEIYDTHVSEHGQEITRRLMNLVHEHDYRHNAFVTIGSNYMSWENAQKCADIVKLAGYNYSEVLYQKHHEEHPDWIIYGSETSSTVQSRGVYHFPHNQSVLSDDDEQCSSLGNSATSWGAKNTEYCITMDRDAKISAGQFIWSGFDYIGEPTPYHTKNSYFGQIDTAGFPKDSYYLYQAEWTSYKDHPMIHLLPYWDFSKGQIIDVRVYSNAPSVELFLNNRSYGKVAIDHEHGTKLSGDWAIEYEPGTLRAVAYDENGVIIACEEQRSFTDATSIVLTPETTTMHANGTDLIYVTISMKDSNGVEVANANNRVTVQVTGAGRLIGLDNGDSTDYDSYKGISRKLFSGKLSAVIAAKLTPGDIHITVSSEGLPSAFLTLTSLPCAKDIIGVSAIMENQAEPEAMDNHEIPVRKLELLCPEGFELTDTKDTMTIAVKLHPVNATYQDVEWRLTNQKGIDSNLGTLSANGKQVTLHALADGEVTLRCNTRNGAPKIRMISQLNFHIHNLGDATINPYGFVAGGLYNSSNHELTNGNEHGVATLRDKDSYFTYENLDFGPFGSDEITLPIFSLSSAPVDFELWEGMPYEQGSERLLSAIYQKNTIWNTYQEETYHLNRKIKGLTTLGFVFHTKIHLAGFSFTALNKAYEKLTAKECDTIYGDTYTIAENSIQGIGNNVTLVYHDMDFKDTHPSCLQLCGYSPISNNTIHIRFDGEFGSHEILAEYCHTEDISIKEFPISEITGMQTISFIFLPGSNFDFHWFRFQ